MTDSLEQCLLTKVQHSQALHVCVCVGGGFLWKNEEYKAAPSIKWTEAAFHLKLLLICFSHILSNNHRIKYKSSLWCYNLNEPIILFFNINCD